MRFITLFALLKEKPGPPYSCPHDGSGSWWCGNGCNQKMPYNWITSHDSSFLVFQMKRHGSDYESIASSPPKPVRFTRETDDDDNDIEYAWGYYPVGYTWPF